MGILSGALAVFAMREMRDNAMEKSPGANMTSSFYGIPSGAGSELQRKVSFYPAAISSTVDHSRRLSSEQQQNDSPPTEKQAVKTFTAATGLIETTFWINVPLFTYSTNEKSMSVSVSCSLTGARAPLRDLVDIAVFDWLLINKGAELVPDPEMEF